MTASDDSIKQRLTDLEAEGIQSGDQEKAWARIKTMGEFAFRRDAVDIDRSGVNTYHFKASLADTSRQDTSSKQPIDLPAWQVRDQFLTNLNACKF